MTDPLRSVLDLLAPARCAACGGRAAVTPCDACQQHVVRRGGDGCPRCGGPRTVGHGCWPRGGPIRSTRVVHDYRGPIAAAVATAKLTGARAVWVDLAADLAQHVGRMVPAVDVVVPVATARSRVRRRGVDHAQVLACAVGVATGIPVVALLRVSGRPPTEQQRARRALPGSAVLLVDDVLTTGRTAGGAAAALRAAGAGEIHLAVLARAGDRPLVAP